YLESLPGKSCALDQEHHKIDDEGERQDEQRHGARDPVITEEREKDPGDVDERVGEIHQWEEQIPPDENRRHPEAEKKAGMGAESLDQASRPALALADELLESRWRIREGKTVFAIADTIALLEHVPGQDDVFADTFGPAADFAHDIGLVERERP